MLTESEYIKQGIEFLDKMPWKEKDDPEWRSGYIGNLKIKYRNMERPVNHAD
jgi:hypothetical protein